MNNRLVSPNVDSPSPSNDADLSDLQATPESRPRTRNTREDSRISSGPVQSSISTAALKDPLQQLSIQPKKRSSLKARVHRAPSTSRDLEVRLKEGRTPSNNKASRKASPTGILSNPYYPYRGGPLSRLIILLANLLKAVERLLLRGLGKGTAVEQTVTPAPPPHVEQKRTEQTHTLSAQEDSLSLLTASSSDDETDSEDDPADSYGSSAGSAS